MTFGGKTNTPYHLELPRIDGVYLSVPDGVEPIEADRSGNAKIVATRFYNLQGQAIAAAPRGEVTIRVDILSDGSIRPAKTLTK